MSHRSILGIDLASKRWLDIGTCQVSRSAAIDIKAPALSFPQSDLTSSELARFLLREIHHKHISIVSIDGPHAWRDPNADPDRPGVGRLCEYIAKCQGKTGVLGKTIPKTQLRWTKFSIDLFSILLNCGGRLVNDPAMTVLPAMPKGQFWLIECFPTHVWKSRGIFALPAKSKIGKDRVRLTQFAESLRLNFDLPDFMNENVSHDDLQAVVAALPAMALAGWLPQLTPVAMGIPCTQDPNTSIATFPPVEGLIWSVAHRSIDQAVSMKP